MTHAAQHANRYPDMGCEDIRRALAEYLGLSSSQVAMGCGSSALCQQLVQITCTPGYEVVFPWRSFEAYPIFAQVVGAQPVPVPLDAEGRNDLDALADAITERTRLVFVCNPNNPTGATVSAEALDAFLDRVPDSVLVAFDEAYHEFDRSPDAPQALDIIARRPNVVALRTFSKAYGLAGVRIGYAFGPEEIITALNKVALPFGVNAVAQAGALASLTARDELLARTEVVVQERDRVAEALGTRRSQANFVWLPTPADDADYPQRIAAALAKHGVLVRAFPEGVRVTVTIPEETDRLLAAWENEGLG